jgi:SSS family solute:Na+ symporter
MITPPLGLLGVWIGLALRNSGVAVEASQALPFFIRTYFHPLAAGLLWSGIMITVLGTSVGITFGVATNLTRDMYLKTKRAAAYDDAKILFASRITVLGTVIAAGLIALAAGKSMILPLGHTSAWVIKGAGNYHPPSVAAVFSCPKACPPGWSFLSEPAVWRGFSPLGGDFSLKENGIPLPARGPGPLRVVPSPSRPPS